MKVLVAGQPLSIWPAARSVVESDNGSITVRRHLARFRLCKSERAFGRIASLYSPGLLEESFVKLGWFDPEIDAGGGEEPRPHGTGRSEDQILSHSSRDGGRAIS
jgi:hypothetical protein